MTGDRVGLNDIPRLVSVMVAMALVACENQRYEELRPDRILDVGVPHNAGSTDSNAVLIGAGDIGDCTRPGVRMTGKVVDSLLNATTAEAWVFTLGDNAYDRGTATEFLECYDPFWGRFRAVTRPVTGNHEWKHGQLLRVLPVFGNADPYFAYFSSFPGQVGEPDAPWYRYTAGSWDVIALDPGKTRGIDRDDALWRWLEAELTDPERSVCTLVYSHYPRFSVGTHGDNPRMRDVWELMDRLGVDVLVSGHDHKYQRFEPATADGAPESSGIRQFVVGTGGGELRQRTRPSDGPVVLWSADHYGVIKFTLSAGAYAWEFVTSAGVFDSGTGQCET